MVFSINRIGGNISTFKADPGGFLLRAVSQMILNIGVPGCPVNNGAFGLAFRIIKIIIFRVIY